VSDEQKPDMVNSPPHYNHGAIEVIDALEAWDLPYHLACVVKYVARCQHKGKMLEDLKKSQWYLNRFIANLESGKWVP
jgi:hypothetical protein